MNYTTFKQHTNENISGLVLMAEVATFIKDRGNLRIEMEATPTIFRIFLCNGFGNRYYANTIPFNEYSWRNATMILAKHLKMNGFDVIEDVDDNGIKTFSLGVYD